MSEVRAVYTVPQPKTTIPRDLFNFWRRINTLAKGRSHLVLLNIPETQSEPVTWVILGEGKRENEG